MRKLLNMKKNMKLKMSKSHTSNIIKVYIDDREPSYFIDAFNDISIKNKVSVKRLTVGDVVTKNFIYERKTVTDLLSSIYDGRIFEQLTNLSRSKRSPAIIIEIQNLFNLDSVKQSQVTGVVRRVCDKIPVMFSTSFENTAFHILKREKDFYKPDFTQKIFKSKLSGLTLFQKVLCLCDGISVEKSIEISRYYNTVCDVLNADSKEFINKIDGIGEKRLINLTSTLILIKKHIGDCND